MREDRRRPYWQKLKIQNVIAITVFFILRFSGNHVFTPRIIILPWTLRALQLWKFWSLSLGKLYILPLWILPLLKLSILPWESYEACYCWIYGACSCENMDPATVKSKSATRKVIKPAIRYVSNISRNGRNYEACYCRRYEACDCRRYEACYCESYESCRWESY